jgi:riboflavin biosynthesis pyrimidine reductase
VFGVAPADRPNVAINMVTTIDGKSISGERDEAVMDLGSAADHDALRQIEHAAQAVLIGAGTHRATPKIRYPDHLLRFVVSRSGAVDPASGFFTARPDRAFLVVPRGVAPPLAEERVLRIGEGEVDFRELVRRMRVDYGIETLVVEGGSETNARLLAADLVDELFLTLAPKIKLGRDLPTYAGGDPLPRHGLLGFRLIEHHVVADEVFLRYRRARDSDEGGSEHV